MCYFSPFTKVTQKLIVMGEAQNKTKLCNRSILLYKLLRNLGHVICQVQRYWRCQ